MRRDVFICVLVELRQRGFNLHNLLDAARIKFHEIENLKIETRPDGTIHHIR